MPALIGLVVVLLLAYFIYSHTGEQARKPPRSFTEQIEAGAPGNGAGAPQNAGGGGYVKGVETMLQKKKAREEAEKDALGL